MATMPPRGTMGGPPPGSTPQGLSRIPRGDGPPAPEGPAPGGAGGGGVARLFYEVEKSLDALAGVLPEQTEKIDGIKSQLREVLGEAVSGGASFTGNPQSLRGKGTQEPGLV